MMNEMLSRERATFNMNDLSDRKNHYEPTVCRFFPVISQPYFLY
jgi:hypothetical protein